MAFTICFLFVRHSCTCWHRRKKNAVHSSCHVIIILLLLLNIFFFFLFFFLFDVHEPEVECTRYECKTTKDKIKSNIECESECHCRWICSHRHGALLLFFVVIALKWNERHNLLLWNKMRMTFYGSRSISIYHSLQDQVRNLYSLKAIVSCHR